MTPTDNDGDDVADTSDAGTASARFGEGLFGVVGLRRVEERAYLALLRRRGGMTPAELQQATGIGEEQARAVLDSLLTKGLISRAPGDEIRYVASPPDVALEALLLEKRQQIERAELAARDLLPVYASGAGTPVDPARLVEVVVGRDAVMQRFLQVQRITQHEIRIIDKPRTSPPPPKTPSARNATCSPAASRYAASTTRPAWNDSTT